MDRPAAICRKNGTYRKREVLIQFYTHQLSSNAEKRVQIFDSFFACPAEAAQCRALIQSIGWDHHVPWPPVDHCPGAVPFHVICITDTVFVPFLPRFMDPGTVRACFALYDV